MINTISSYLSYEDAFSKYLNTCRESFTLKTFDAKYLKDNFSTSLEAYLRPEARVESLNARLARGNLVSIERAIDHILTLESRVDSLQRSLSYIHLFESSLEEIRLKKEQYCKRVKLILTIIAILAICTAYFGALSWFVSALMGIFYAGIGLMTIGGVFLIHACRAMFHWQHKVSQKEEENRAHQRKKEKLQDQLENLRKAQESSFQALRTYHALLKGFIEGQKEEDIAVQEIVLPGFNDNPHSKLELSDLSIWESLRNNIREFERISENDKRKEDQVQEIKQRIYLSSRHIDLILQLNNKLYLSSREIEDIKLLIETYSFASIVRKDRITCYKKHLKICLIGTIALNFCSIFLLIALGPGSIATGIVLIGVYALLIYSVYVSVKTIKHLSRENALLSRTIALYREEIELIHKMNNVREKMRLAYHWIQDHMRKINEFYVSERTL